MHRPQSPPGNSEMRLSVIGVGGIKEGVKGTGEKRKKKKAKKSATDVSHVTSRSASRLWCEDSPSLQPSGEASTWLLLWREPREGTQRGHFQERVSFLNPFPGVFFYHRLAIYPES